MNNKLEETLGLFPSDDGKYENLPPPPKPEEISKVVGEANEVINALKVSEKIDYALTTVEGIERSDNEMDEIANKALESYQNLCDMSVNLQDNYIGRVYEVAASMLKVALDAREAKVNRKLKTLELQLKKASLDKEQGGGDGDKPSGNKYDRNELLAIIKANKDNSGKSDK